MHSHVRSPVGQVLCCVGALVLGVGLGGAAQAQTTAAPQLDPVIVQGRSAREGISGKLPRRTRSATKTDTRLLDAPQSVSVITETELGDSGARAISQALAYSPGVHAAPGGGNDGSRYDFFSLRGQSYNGALFFDGMRGSPLHRAQRTWVFCQKG